MGLDLLAVRRGEGEVCIARTRKEGKERRLKEVVLRGRVLFSFVSSTELNEALLSCNAKTRNEFSLFLG